MKQVCAFISKSVIGGMMVLIPLYLAVLVMLKGMKTVAGLVRPVALLLPDWIPAERLLSLLLILAICFLIGAALRTRKGREAREQIETRLFGNIPGYALFRGLTQRVAGDSRSSMWKPALVEIEEALVPAFIIEELDGDRYTVFVPSIPTPLAGAVYILDRKRVHPLNVPFTEALKVVSRWGSGSKDLIAAMEKSGLSPK